jgi:hypothetical protein
MKKLIFSLIFALPFTAWTQELIDADTGRQIVSVVKDMQVGSMLEKTSEFKKCRDLNTYKQGANKTTRDNNVKAAADCFKNELSKNSDPEKLKELSENLNLQQYGLVQGQNVKAIQKYLTDKMIETLTGVNPSKQTSEQYKESLKFGKKKIVDQKLFIDMYKTQLGKNALHEVSRFCFENLRSDNGNSTKTSFGEYWATYQPGSINVNNVNDLGVPKFGQVSDASNNDKIFKDIFESIQGQDGQSAMDEFKMSSFFMECGKLIVPLCAKFELASKANVNTNESKVDAPTTLSLGASACLAKGRIQDYKKALINAETVAERFNEMAAEDRASLIIGLDNGAPQAKLFGQDASDPTIDDLTNNTSADILMGGVTPDKSIDQRAQECTDRPELASCEGFIAEGDDLDRAKHSIETEMTLKREIEMARVRELKIKNDATLEDYLKDNGFFDLLDQDKYKSMKDDDLVEAIGQSYEAKKQATLEKINAKLGSRQVKAGEQINKTAAATVVTESKEERARLAQVVLFNNIITSHLSLKKKDASGNLQNAGRNVNAWKKEELALQNAKVSADLFENLKANSDGSTGLDKDSQIAGFEILDELLGKPSDR